MNSPRASASLGASTSGLVRSSLRHSGGPLFLFGQAPQNFSGHLVQTNEARATVPRWLSMAGATLHTIPVPGYPGSLPPVLLQVNYVAHPLSPVGVSQAQLSEECIHEDGKAFCNYGKFDAHG